jgi:hypothetical protein
MLALIFSFLLSAHAQELDTTANGGPQPAKNKNFADVTFSTNCIERGLTRTQNGPCMQSAFGYQSGDAQLGIWGSNVRFISNVEHFNYRIFFNYLTVLNPYWDFQLRYDLSQYSLNTSRNGSQFLIGFGVYTYHFNLERVDNSLGSGTTRTSLIIYKSFDLPFDLFWKIGAAYNILSGSGYGPYVDAYTSLGYKMKEFEFALNASVNTAASQFSGDGETAFWFSMGTKF